MFKIKNLLKIGIINMALALGIPATANASRITHIRHPKFNMVFNAKSLYYRTPHKSKIAIFPEEADQIYHMSTRDENENIPVRIKPYLKTSIRHQTWYKFSVSPADGKVSFQAWIPSYGLSRYPKLSRHYLRTHRDPITGKVHFNRSIARDLQHANTSYRLYIQNLKRAKAARRSASYYLKKANQIWNNQTDSNASDATLLSEEQQIGKVQNKLIGL